MIRRIKKSRCTEQTTIRLPKHLDEKLAGLAASSGVTRGSVIRRLITRTRMGVASR